MTKGERRTGKEDMAKKQTDSDRRLDRDTFRKQIETMASKLRAPGSQTLRRDIAVKHARQRKTELQRLRLAGKKMAAEAQEDSER
jgi:predicted kinase